MSAHTAGPPATAGTVTGQPVLLAPGDGHSVLLRGSKVTFKVRSDQAGGVSCAELAAAAGFDTGLHLHSKLEEAFYVLEGEFELRAGDQARRARPGTLMFVPPGVPHAFSNPTDAPARLLLLMSPPGHDRYFTELADILAHSGPPDTEAIAALRRKYDTEQLSSLVASTKLLDTTARPSPR
jgi:quercetin dioxygenase-like cupin family protein